jgi:hypothetical protein
VGDAVVVVSVVPVEASGVAVAIGVVASIGVVLAVVVVVLSVVVSGEADAAGEVVVVVSVFCSQAARSAAVARMQMYFFIFFGLTRPYWAKG